MRQSTHVRTLAEIALVRICKLEDLDALSGLIAAVKSGQPLPAQTSIVQKKTADLTSPPPPRTVIPPATPTPTPAAPVLSPQPAAPSPPPSSEPLDLATAQKAWQQTLADLADLTAEMAAAAETIAISAPNRLVARFRPQYTLQKETCERPERRSRLVQTLGRILGRTVSLDFELLPDDGQSRGGSSAPSRPPETQATRRQRQREIEKYPFVNQAIELFDAEVVQVVEGVRNEGEEIRPEERVEESG
jgi:DNA polymerase-3 subunit gamma/tau